MLLTFNHHTILNRQLGNMVVFHNKLFFTDPQIQESESVPSLDSVPMDM